MPKQTKRARKFQSSGGVSSRLKKGTITSKGKLKRKGRSDAANDRAIKKAIKAGNSYADELEYKRNDEDLTSKKNLGDLDLESFFSSAVEENEDAAQESEEDEVEDQEGSDDDDDDDDDDGDDEEDSDDSDEEQDIGAVEDQMKQEIENDPEFHQFLKENDQSILDFEDDDNDEDEDVMADDQKQSEPLERGVTLVTSKVLKRMEQGAFKSHGVKGLKKYVNVFKAACHMADADQAENAKANKYHIESSVVFDHLMVTALGRCHEEFHYHLLRKATDSEGDSGSDSDSADGDADDDEEAAADKDGDSEEIDPNKPIQPKQMEKSNRWGQVQPIIQTFLRAAIHLLSEAKEPDLLAFVLKALVSYLPYCSPFPRLSESLLKAFVTLWSAPIDANEDYQVVRLHAFLRIRQLALTQPFPFIETSLKKVYLAYAQRAKFTASSTASLPTLTFMGNCIVELYSLDYHSSYQHAFIYIRQLALHLRSAMQKKTQEAFAVVYCWQYMHCLKLWVAVLTAACQSQDATGEEQLLQSLLFPLSQVIIGTCKMIPSARYLPLRLHCIRLLQQLAGAAEVFLPTTSILLDALDTKELYQQAKKMDKAGIQSLSVTLKLRADSPLRTMEELEMCVSELFVLLNREMDLYRYSAGFPEFSVRVVQRLRKFAKDTRNARWRAYAKGCIDMAERFSKAAVLGRSKLTEIAPKDVKRLEILKPIQTPSMGARWNAAVLKEKRLEVATRPAQKRSAEQQPKKQKQRKKAKKQRKQQPTGVENPEALAEEDQVQMGIDWSDEE